MLFNSYIFIFLFFPITLIGYYGLKRFKKAFLPKLFLIGMSFWFYSYFNVSYLLILIGSIAVNYGFYLLLVRTDGALGDKLKFPLRKLIYLSGVIINIGVLFYFKYYDFFLINLNSVFKTDFTLAGVLLPLGISFFTFQQIGFLTDTYKREIKRCAFIDYALFVSFFPQLIAGPIVSHDEMLPQFERICEMPFDPAKCSKGLYLFVLGLGKKVLIADIFAGAVDGIYTYRTITLDSTTGILVMFFYSVQLYFDFSGYCDMARGLGHMLMIDIPINFNSPYRAVNLVDFWKRWHVTLTRFLTKNLYYPMGGNRKGKVRQMLNIFFVFLISGVWHGAGWNFIFWGVLHGVGQIISRLMHPLFDRMDRIGNKIVRNIFKVLCTGFTFIYVSIAWVFFRAESVQQALEILKIVFGPTFAHINQGNVGGMASFFNWTGIATSNVKINLLFMGFYSILACVLMWIVPCAGDLEERWKPTAGRSILTVGVLMTSLIFMSGVSTFLYFNF